MADIAIEAGMSVGHIYRYFASKEAIIAAIVKDELDQVFCDMSDLPLSRAELRGALLERIEKAVLLVSNPAKAIMMVEISAEAARNPAICRIVREADKEVFEQLRVLLSGAIGGELSGADLDARTAMLQLLFQGASIQAIRNPCLKKDALFALATLTIDVLLKQHVQSTRLDVIGQRRRPGDVASF